MKISSYIVSIGFLLLLSCNNPDNKLDGYWHGTVSVDNMVFPHLAYFNNGECILNNVDLDSFYYQIDNNKIHFTPKSSSDTFTIDYALKGDSLILTRKSDNFIDFKLERISKNLVNKLINVSKLEIELPNFDAYQETIFKLCYPDESYIFLDKVRGNVILKHQNDSVVLDSSTYELIRQNMDYDHGFRYKQFYIFIDKEVNKDELDLLYWNLRLASIYKPKLVLESTKPDYFKYLLKHLKPFDASDYDNLPSGYVRNRKLLSPPLPDILTNSETVAKFPVYHVHNDSFTDLRNHSDSLSKEYLKKEIINKNIKAIFLIYHDKDVSYEQYIKFSSQLFLIIQEVKNEFSLMKYNTEYHLLNYTNKDFIDSEFPFYIRDLDYDEFTRIKYLL